MQIIDHEYKPYPPILSLWDNKYEVINEEEYIKGHARITLKRM